MDENLSNFNRNLKTAMGMKENQPKITVNKLGEFLTATARRQRKILEQLKYPKENKFAFTGYNEAREAIRQYFINDMDEDILLSALEGLDEKEATSPYHIGMIKSSEEAMEKVLESEILTNKDFTIHPYEGKNPKMIIQGVEVSIYPDLILKSKSRGNNNVGAMKIQLSKVGGLDGDSGKYVATMLNKFTELHIKKKNELVRNDHCVSYDVHSDNIVVCPNSVKRRWEDIEAGCLNIVAIWDSI